MPELFTFDDPTYRLLVAALIALAAVLVAAWATAILKRVRHRPGATAQPLDSARQIKVLYLELRYLDDDAWKLRRLLGSGRGGALAARDLRAIERRRAEIIARLKELRVPNTGSPGRPAYPPSPAPPTSRPAASSAPRSAA